MTHTVAVEHAPAIASAPLPPPPFDPPNLIYSMVSRTLASGGWDGLSGIVEPGMRVLIKPNFVTDRYYHERLADRRLLASSTHASVIRPLVDFALARGAREVLVADCPIEGCDLPAVTSGLGFDAMIDALSRRGQPVRFLDLRPFKIEPRMLVDDWRFAGRSWNLGLLRRVPLAGDPSGYVTVDLGARSRFCGIEARCRRLRFHRANPSTPVPHHIGGRHEYRLPKSVLESDVVVHVPKLKTHKKSGVTMALKSAIGLCGFKYWLPHYTEGAPPGGDEYPAPPRTADRLAARMSRLPIPGGHSIVARAPRVDAVPAIIEGSWEGNDTIWRTTLDLAAAISYADAAGVLHDRPVRRTFALVDGLVAGEGEGPFGVDPVEAGLLVAGEDPALVDAVCAETMGFDFHRIPTIANAFADRLLPTSTWERVDRRWSGPPCERTFVAPRSWRSLGGGSASAGRAAVAAGEDWAG